MNSEHPYHKTGLIGEFLVNIKLNDYGINTGGVDKDTGTDVIMFHGNKILTAQVKSGFNRWNYEEAHGVHVHFRVNLKCVDGNLRLDETEIRWKRIDIQNGDFKNFTHESIAEIFQ